MIRRFELWHGDNNCDLCCLSDEPDGEWVAYDDYAVLLGIYEGLVKDIKAMPSPVPAEQGET